MTAKTLSKMCGYISECKLKFFDHDGKFNEIKEISAVSGIEILVDEQCGDICVTLRGDCNNEAFFRVIETVKEIYNDYLYAEEGQSLEEKTVAELNRKGAILSAAESFTGGMISSMIVSVSGASKVFYEGIVCYDIVAKVRRLHVPSFILDKFGAVSRETCDCMLNGLLESKRINCAVATTGCAGPESDEGGTPVGRIYVGAAYGDDRIIIERNITNKNRNYIREYASKLALFSLIKKLKG